MARALVLDTAQMSATRLSAYGLVATSSLAASDHLPTVVELGFRD